MGRRVATLTVVKTVPPVPGAVRGAGVLAAVQGAAALLVAAVLVVRGLAGADERAVNGFGTAVWFALAGGAVLAASAALLRGRRWGRGIGVFVNLLLLPVAWYAGVGSHRWGYGAVVGVFALAVLGLLFSPPVVRWAAARPVSR